MSTFSYSIGGLSILRELPVRFDHHGHKLQRRVQVNGVPLDPIAHKVVAVRPFMVVDAIQVRLEATLEPPGSVVVFSAVVVEALIVILVVGAEQLAVVTLPVGCHRVAGVAAEAVHVKPVLLGLAFNAEVVVLHPVLVVVPVLHLNTQLVVTCKDKFSV